MNSKFKLLLAILFLNTAAVTAQVQVSKEPRHKKVLENKYIRLLDVRIPPGDTTLFHIHSTPSLFLHFTNTVVCSQEKGQTWEKSKSKEGEADYVSFKNETWVHRASNCDTIPFHVTVIEILSPYKTTTHPKPLPFAVLFENEKAFAYRFSSSSFNKQLISGRGPMVAELVAGDEVIYHDTMKKKLIKIKTGKILYIKPGSSFYFSAKGDDEINMVLFEIK